MPGASRSRAGAPSARFRNAHTMAETRAAPRGTCFLSRRAVPRRAGKGSRELLAVRIISRPCPFAPNSLPAASPPGPDANSPHRSGDCRCLPSRRHRVGHSLPPLAAGRARLFPRRQIRALVGPGFLDCRHRNLDAHHHRDARHRLLRQSHLSPACPRLSCRSRAHRALVAARLFSWRVLHGLRRHRKALRPPNAFRRREHFPRNSSHR